MSVTVKIIYKHHLQPTQLQRSWIGFDCIKSLQMLPEVDIVMEFLTRVYWRSKPYDNNAK